jgi:hypothetical protein
MVFPCSYHPIDLRGTKGGRCLDNSFLSIQRPQKGELNNSPKSVRALRIVSPIRIATAVGHAPLSPAASTNVIFLSGVSALRAAADILQHSDICI